jgi:NitT/TauT family transport system substrate-binding protein
MGTRARQWDTALVRLAIATALLLALGACTAPAAREAPAPAPSGAPATAPGAASAPAPASAPASGAAAAPARPLIGPIRIAQAAIAATMSPLWLAKDAGIYERNGLNVEIVSVSAGPLVVQSLISGELEYAYNVASSLIAANLAGADLVMLAGGVNTMGFTIAAHPSIERIEDLKGKRLGITRLGTSGEFNARYVLPRYGIQPETDISFIQLNSNPEILTGLIAGAVDAGMLSHPTVVDAKRQGFRLLLDLGTLGIPYQNTGVMATRRYADAHPDVTRAVLRSHVEAIHKFKTDKAAAIETLARYTQLSDPGILEETWEAFANVYLERVPYVTIPGMQLDVDALAATVPAAAGVKAESYADNRYIEELERSGLFQQLYGR